MRPCDNDKNLAGTFTTEGKTEVKKLVESL